MPSDFYQGRPHKKTLAELLTQLTTGPKAARGAFVSSPTADPNRRNRVNRKAGNRQTDEARRKDMAKQALQELKLEGK
ncbi:MAG: hypothetical protein WD645_03170 [Dehalococcoidia bacterium]